MKTRRLVGTLAILAAGAVALVLWWPRGTVEQGTGGDAPSGSKGASGPRFVQAPPEALEQTPPPPPEFNTPPASEPLPPAQIERFMAGWAQAITSKDVEGVERLDDLFRSRPDEFLPAIMDCAQLHGVAQVRAFCTRVLGNLKKPLAAPRLHILLGDPHEYVRSNAAWALAELQDRTALPSVQRLAKRDPSAAVRKAAADAVERLSSK